MFLIFGASIVSLKTYPNLIVEFAGRDAWISVFFASVLFIVYFLYLINICLKSNQFNLVQIYTKALGKILGTFMIILLGLSLVVALVECGSVEGSSVKNHLLLNTPIWYSLFFFFLAAFYSLKFNLNTIVIACIVGLSFTFIAGINLAFLTVKYKDLKYMFPMMANGFDKNFLMSIVKALALYSTIFIAFPYVDEVTDTKNLKKNSFIAMLIVAQMEIVAMHGLITTFGPERSLTILYPKVIQTQLVSLFHFLESGEFFVLLQIVGGWYIKYIVTSFSIICLLKNYNIHKKILYFATPIIYFITYYISHDNNLLFNFIGNVIVWVFLINFCLIPLIIFTIYFLKFKYDKLT